MKKRLLAIILAISMAAVSLPCLALSPEGYALETNHFPESKTSTSMANYSVNTAYEYPIMPTSDEWLLMESHAARVSVCQVPDGILTQMSTEALVETISNYPLLVDVLLFDYAKDAYQTILSGYNGFQELGKRPDSFEVLNNYIVSNEELQNDFIRKAALEVIALTADFTPSNISIQRENSLFQQHEYTDAYAVYPELMTNYSMALNGASTLSVSSPKTPSGNSLTVATYYNQKPELTQAQINALEEEVLATYGLYPSGPATVKYNCHSYAWHDQSLSNLWWIDFPNDYINDPLVEKATTPSVGDKIVYRASVLGPYLHSGIITTVNGTLTMVKSKWGGWGLYHHTVGNCPSDYGNIKTYYTVN